MQALQDLGLSKVGITQAKELFYNLSYDELFKHETDSALQGYEKGTVTDSGTIAVDTGKFTGRSPKDKYIVENPLSKDKIWWSDDKTLGSDNKRLSQEAWKHLKDLSIQQLSGKKLYVMDGFCGA